MTGRLGGLSVAWESASGRVRWDTEERVLGSEVNPFAIASCLAIVPWSHAHAIV